MRLVQMKDVHGLLWVKEWRPLEIISMSFGAGISLTQ
jgi:hypothetical protein